MVEVCIAKQTVKVKKLTTQGTETIMGKCDEQKYRQKVLCEFFAKMVNDPQCSASAHLTKGNEIKSTSKVNRSEQKPSSRSQPGEHIWSVKDSATKEEIIPILQFPAQNVLFSSVENLAAHNQEQFPDSSIA